MGASPCEVRVLDTAAARDLYSFHGDPNKLGIGGEFNRRNNARHENLNRGVRLDHQPGLRIHSANAALALIMVTLGPIKHVLANVSWFQMSESTHIHAGMPTNEFPPFVRVVGAAAVIG